MSSAISPLNAGFAIDVAIIRKSLDIQEFEGEAALALIDQAMAVQATTSLESPPSVEQHLGRMIDVYA